MSLTLPRGIYFFLILSAFKSVLFVILTVLIKAHMHEDNLDQGRILGGFEYKTSGAWRQSFSFDPSSVSSLIKNIKVIHFVILRFFL
jgi:hypothetical protein